MKGWMGMGEVGCLSWQCEAEPTIYGAYNRIPFRLRTTPMNSENLNKIPKLTRQIMQNRESPCNFVELDLILITRHTHKQVPLGKLEASNSRPSIDWAAYRPGLVIPNTRIVGPDAYPGMSVWRPAGRLLTGYILSICLKRNRGLAKSFKAQ